MLHQILLPAPSEFNGRDTLTSAHRLSRATGALFTGRVRPGNLRAAAVDGIRVGESLEVLRHLIAVGQETNVGADFGVTTIAALLEFEFPIVLLELPALLLLKSLAAVLDQSQAILLLSVSRSPLRRTGLELAEELLHREAGSCRGREFGGERGATGILELNIVVQKVSESIAVLFDGKAQLGALRQLAILLLAVLEHVLLDNIGVGQCPERQGCRLG